MVPIPTLPAFVTTKCVAVEEPTTNSGPVPMTLGLTERKPQGVVVPMLVLPVTERVPPVEMFAPMVLLAKTEALAAKSAPARRERVSFARERLGLGLGESFLNMDMEVMSGE